MLSLLLSEKIIYLLKVITAKNSRHENTQIYGITYQPQKGNLITIATQSQKVNK